MRWWRRNRADAAPAEFPPHPAQVRTARYREEAKALWRTYVPSTGQADNVQGELIRAVERLRYEAFNNGNGNWDSGFEILALYLRSTLVESRLFRIEEIFEVEQDVDRLLQYESPVMDDSLYDRLPARVVDWARAHPEPAPHVHNPDLHR